MTVALIPALRAVSSFRADAREANRDASLGILVQHPRRTAVPESHRRLTMQDLLQRLRTMRSEKDERGFTLIELLVVVVIIGILIAIAIPLYLNYENGAKNKSAASDLRGAISTIEQCYTDNNNAYPTAITGGGNGAAYSATGCANSKINTSSGSAIVYNLATAGTTYSLVSFQGTTGPATGAPWYCYNSSVGGSVKTETGTYTASAAGTPQTC